MVYLLYGSDTQKSRQKLNEIIEEYRKKSGSGLGLYHFDAEETEPERVKETLEAGSLFSSKKLIVIKYFFESKWDRSKFYKVLDGVKDNPDNIVILWDREVPEKEIKAIAPYCKKIQEFNLSGVSGRLLDSSPNVFRLGDTFFTSPREGLRSFLELIRRGHDEFNLFSYLINQARTLLIVKHYQENKKSVPAKHGLHPYAVKRALAFMRAVSSARLYLIFRKFFEEDQKIKTGVTKPKDSLISLLLSKE